MPLSARRRAVLILAFFMASFLAIPLSLGATAQTAGTGTSSPTPTPTGTPGTATPTATATGTEPSGESLSRVYLPSVFRWSPETSTATPTPTASLTATPTNTATPTATSTTPPTGGCVEKVQDGGFEQATDLTIHPQWRVSGDVKLLRGLPAPESHSGQNMVRWGQYRPSEPAQIADLRQAVMMPTAPTEVTLSFWHRTLNPNGPFRIDLDLMDASGNIVLRSFGYFLESEGEWTQLTRTLSAGDLIGLSDQSVHLRFRLYQTAPLDLFTDDVSLKVCS